MITGPSKKIYLSPVERENIEQLRQWRNKSSLRQYFREYREISKEMQSKWFEDKVLNDSNQVNFEIHEFGTDKLIGHCGLYYIDWVNRTGEFGIYIGEKDVRGRGYGTDALSALLNYGFFDLNLNRIWCEVYSNNTAIDSYRRLGFKDEGIKREHVYINGKYIDSYMMGMLKREWEDEDYKTKRKLRKVPDDLIDNLPVLSEKEIENIFKEGRKISDQFRKKLGGFLPINPIDKRHL